MTEKDQSKFDDILDTSLDDIEDLPEYLDFCPTGSFVLEITEAKMDEAEVDDPAPDKKGQKMMAPVMRVTYEILSIGELSDPESANLVKTRETDGAGSRFSESFFFHKDKKKSSEIFKAKYKEVAKKFGVGTVRETLEVLKGAVITSLVKSNKAKDGDRYFINTKNIQVV